MNASTLRPCVALAIAVALVLFGRVPAAAQHPDTASDPPTNTFCLECHEDIQGKMGATPHKAVVSGCVMCHNIKTGTAPYLRANETSLCKGCHAAPLVPIGGRLPETVDLAPGFAVPSTALPQSKRLVLDTRGSGHPVTNHPIGGVPDPVRKGKTLSCVSCHRPHGGGGPKMLAFDLKPGEGICQLCHKL